MHAITSIFFKPTACWGFNAVDENKEDAVVKVETISEEDQHVVMDIEDDGSDSDIEIIESSSFIPRTNSPKGKARDYGSAADTRPANERAGRKRADSPIDLSRDGSPPKKAKLKGMAPFFGSTTAATPILTPTVQKNGLSANATRLRGEYSSPKFAGHNSRAGSPGGSKIMNRTVANRNTDRFRTLLDTGVAQPEDDVSRTMSQSSSGQMPPPPAAAPSSNRRKLGSTLDHIDASEILNSTTMSSIPHKSMNDIAPVSTHLRATGLSSAHPQRRSNTRPGIPFDEDDSDEELVGKEPTPSKDLRTAAAKVAQEQSEPEFDEIVVASRPSLQEETAEQPSGGDRAAAEKPSRGNDKMVSKSHTTSKTDSHLDKIRRQGSVLKSGSCRPSGGTQEASITASKHSSTAFPRFESATHPLEKEVRTQRMINGDSRTKLAASTSRDTTAKRDVTDDGKHRRHDKLRNEQEGSTAKIQVTTASQTIGRVEKSQHTVSTPLRTTSTKVANTADLFVAKPIDAAEEAKIRQKREEAANARKQADIRREAEAKQRAKDKTDAERVQWEKQQKFVKARRETERQKQQQAAEEGRVFAEGKAALSKLSEVKPAPLPSKKITTDDAGGLNDMLATVSTRRESAPLSQPMIQPKEVTGSLNYDEASNHETTTTRPASQSENSKVEYQFVSASQHGGAAREQRIREMKERNERRRIADKEEERRQLAAEREEEQRRLEQSNAIAAAGDSASQRSKGPFALNSTTGQRLVAETRNTPGKTSHGRRLGEITAADIEVLKWRDNMTLDWPDVVRLWSKKYPVRSQDTLRKRYKQVKDAITAAKISEMQRADLYTGCEETRFKLNRKINGDLHFSGQPAPSPLREDGAAPVARNRPSVHSSPTNKHKRQSSFSSGVGCESPTLAGSPAPPKLSREKEDHSVRPTQGGKTMNAETFQYYLDSLAEAYADNEEDTETRSMREPSPWGPDDYAPFTYQVERRELDQDTLKDGYRIDEEAWTICGRYREFDTALAANLEAYQELFRNPEFGVRGVDLSKGREHRTEIDEGMEFHELKDKSGGVRQVRVTRYMRSFGRGELPHNKEGWAPRTVYLVKDRLIRESEPQPPAVMPSEDGEIDELFEERPKQMAKQVSETDVEGVYTTLELANTAAVKEFVKHTFTPKSGNLGLRSFEIQEEEARFLRDLDEGEIFRQKAEFEDVKGTYEIWVEEGELKGPRNLD